MCECEKTDAIPSRPIQLAGFKVVAFTAATFPMRVRFAGPSTTLLARSRIRYSIASFTGFFVSPRRSGILEFALLLLFFLLLLFELFASFFAGVIWSGHGSNQAAARAFAVRTVHSARSCSISAVNTSSGAETPL